MLFGTLDIILILLDGNKSEPKCFDCEQFKASKYGIKVLNLLPGSVGEHKPPFLADVKFHVYISTDTLNYRHVFRVLQHPIKQLETFDIQ